MSIEIAIRDEEKYCGVTVKMCAKQSQKNKHFHLMFYERSHEEVFT